jgi:lysophospholipase L1-like esterase
MNPAGGGPKGRPGVESGGPQPHLMAHYSPKFAQTKRLMAHPVRRGPFWAVYKAIASLLPSSDEAGSTSASPRFPGQLEPEQHRRRDFAVVLALLIVAAAVSASLPGGWIGSGSASPTGPLAADLTSPRPTVSAGGGSPSPTAAASPAPTQQPPSASPTRLPAPTTKPTLQPTKTPIPGKTYVTLGDSLTAWPIPDPWPVLLDRVDTRLRLVHNAGVPGDVTGQMLSRLDTDVFAYKPNVLFILGGTNDVGHRISQNTTIANLRAIINAARAKNVRVFLITIPPEDSAMAARIDSLNAAITHLANGYRIVVINIHDPLSTSAGVYVPKYTSDGLHFSNLGAQLVANTINRRIHRLGY